MDDKRVARGVLALIGGLLLTGLQPADLGLASAICPTEADVCLVVNTSSDTVQQDQFLSLREAIGLLNGNVQCVNLSSAEQNQIIPPGIGCSQFTGSTYVLFDIQSMGGGTPTIQLTQPGLILSAAPTQVASLVSSPSVRQAQMGVKTRERWNLPFSPPLLGGGPGPGVVLGLPAGTPSGAPTSLLVLDGGQLPESSPCLTVERSNTWVRSLSLRNCSVGVAVRSDVFASTLFGSNGDGFEDDLEQIAFDRATVITNILIY